MDALTVIGMMIPLCVMFSVLAVIIEDIRRGK
jgi:hypothetical protein